MIYIGDKEMGRVFVISDLHGYYDLFIKLLKEISFSEEDKLYIVGDVLDRGEDSLKILFYVQEHDNIVLIKGNHEYMMQEALAYNLESEDFDYSLDIVKLWVANGGDKTIKNINDYLEKETMSYEYYRIIRKEFLKRVYEYLKNLPTYLEISVNQQNYVLVHAGIDVRKPLNLQEESVLLWIREKFYLQRGDLTKIYIFGHTPTVLLNNNFSFDIWFDDINQNKIGIDGGLACGTVGQLNCICLNDGSITIIDKNPRN